MEEREYDDINSEHTGHDEFEPQEMPITEDQRKTIYRLVYNAILTPDQKEGYRRALDCKLTWTEAEGLKQELRVIQLPVLDQHKPYEKERNKAISQVVNRDNT